MNAKGEKKEVNLHLCITVLAPAYSAHEHGCIHGAVCSQMSVATVTM